MSAHPSVLPPERRTRRAPLATAAAATAVTLFLPRTGAAQSFAERFVLRGELGAGTMLARYQRDTQGYNLDVQGSGRLGFTLIGPLALQASFSSWWFPIQGAGDTRAAGQQYSVTGGGRGEPMLG